MSIISDILALLGFRVSDAVGEAYDGGKSIGTIYLSSVGYSASGKEIFLRDDVAADFLRMKEAAKAEAGITLTPTSGFRTMAEQIALYKKNVLDAPAANVIPTAKPGFSNHQDGTAIDISTGMTIADLKSGSTTATFRWLDANSRRFGLIRLPSEPWHYSRSGR